MVKQIYMPPEAKITVLKDFDLTKIEETFQYASFERRISKRKVHLIAQAIMDNKFTDNVLRVVNASPSKYEVLDGQHRIEGLRYARDEFGLQTYELIIFCYLGGNRREIYRRLNLGKPLSLADHLKGIDDGKNNFFNSLRQECDHYRNVDKIPYQSIINSLFYSKSVSIRAIRPLDIDDFISGITSRDIETVKRFIPILKQVATNPDSMFWHYTLFRNYFRIFYENKLSTDDMIKLGDVLKRATKIRELSEKRDTFAMRGIYHYIIDIASPKVGLRLSKGDVKNSL